MLTSSLVGNVIVYLCFLTFSSFSFSVRDLFQNRFLVRCVVTHICREMGLHCSLVQMTYQLSKYLPFTVPPAWFVTPRSSSKQIDGSHCVSYFPSKGQQISFHRYRLLQGSLPSQHVQSIPLLFFKAHSLQAFEQPLIIFRNRPESKHLEPYLQMTNTVSDAVKSYFLISIRLD